MNMKSATEKDIAQTVENSTVLVVVMHVVGSTIIYAAEMENVIIAERFVKGVKSVVHMIMKNAMDMDVVHFVVAAT